jgi:hypothetical protein
MADELDGSGCMRRASGEVWDAAAREAARWLRRAAALDGATGGGDGSARGPATFEVRWGVAMGVTYPRRRVCAVGGSCPGGSSALAFAVRAHREALEVAVRLAAADRAIALLGAELAATRSRNARSRTGGYPGSRPSWTRSAGGWRNRRWRRTLRSTGLRRRTNAGEDRGVDVESRGFGHLVAVPEENELMSTTILVAVSEFARRLTPPRGPPSNMPRGWAPGARGLSPAGGGPGTSD